MCQTQLPKRFWAEAMLINACLVNHMPSCAFDDKTLWSLLMLERELFFLTPTIFEYMRFICNHGPNVSKLHPRAIKGIFLGSTT